MAAMAVPVVPGPAAPVPGPVPPGGPPPQTTGVKRQPDAPLPTDDVLEIMPLGAGQEVGRSCVHMTYKGKVVMFDCGVHPAYSGLAAMPYFDFIDPSAVELLLVTHFHLDHCASLPYFVLKTTFKGRVFMTHATKAIYRLMLADFVKVSRGGADDAMFDEADVAASMERIECVDFHQEKEVGGVKFRAYQAGHVLGAAMFLVDIAGVTVLYTGDYSREEDRHLKAAELPDVTPDVVIVESTYGTTTHEPRRERERRFTGALAACVARGGRVLVPVFALGRTQELLLIIDEFWGQHPALAGVPVYYAAPLAKKCMGVYKTYINSMNDRLRAQFEAGGANPFDFGHVSELSGLEGLPSAGACVVLATPGMLQSGLSRQLFDLWCADRRNLCVVAGYCVEGTLAKAILAEPKDVQLLSGATVPLRMAVEYISFSAHADYAQTSAFLEELRPRHVVLVHGEATQMAKLKAALQHTFEGTPGPPVAVTAPKNCAKVQMRFRGEKTVKVVGRLADAAGDGLGEGARVSGLLARKGFSEQLVAPGDLASHTQLTAGRVTQRLAVPCGRPLVELLPRLARLFDGCSLRDGGGGGAGDGALSVGGDAVLLTRRSPRAVVMTWTSGHATDAVADALVALLLEAEGLTAEATVELKPGGGGEAAATAWAYPPPPPAARADVVETLLRAMFGSVQTTTEPPRDPESGDPSFVSPPRRLLRVAVDGAWATVDAGAAAVVDASEEGLRERLATTLRRIAAAQGPIDVGC